MFNLHVEVFSFCTKSQRSIQSFCTVVVSFARNKLQKSKTPSSGFKTKMCKVVTKRPVARFFRICHRDFEKPWSVEDGRRNGFLVVKKDKKVHQHLYTPAGLQLVPIWVFAILANQDMLTCIWVRHSGWVRFLTNFAKRDIRDTHQRNLTW